jgi:hypothetical protein
MMLVVICVRAEGEGCKDCGNARQMKAHCRMMSPVLYILRREWDKDVFACQGSRTVAAVVLRTVPRLKPTI